MANGGGILGTSGALGRLIRAVETFGFHLARLDLRQNADVHEGVVAELLRGAEVLTDYLSLGENARVALLLTELATPVDAARVVVGGDRQGTRDRPRGSGRARVTASTLTASISCPRRRAYAICSRSMFCSRKLDSTRPAIRRPST